MDPLEDTPEEELIDHEYCRTLVCPYCGFEHRDPDDITGNDEDGEMDCYLCGKPMWWHRHVEITYSTEKC